MATNELRNLHELPSRYGDGRGVEDDDFGEATFAAGDGVEAKASASDEWESATIQKQHSGDPPRYKVVLDSDPDRPLKYHPADLVRRVRGGSTRSHAREPPSAVKKSRRGGHEEDEDEDEVEDGRRSKSRRRHRDEGGEEEQEEDDAGEDDDYAVPYNGGFLPGDLVEFCDDQGFYHDAVVDRPSRDGSTLYLRHGAARGAGDAAPEKVASAVVRRRTPAFVHLDVTVVQVHGRRQTFEVEGKVIVFWSQDGLAASSSFQVAFDGQEGVSGAAAGGGGKGGGRRRRSLLLQPANESEMLETDSFVFPLDPQKIFANSVAETSAGYGGAMGEVARQRWLRYYPGESEEGGGGSRRGSPSLVAYELRFQAELKSRLDMRRFPFDRQVLPLELNLVPRFQKPVERAPFIYVKDLARLEGTAVDCPCRVALGGDLVKRFVPALHPPVIDTRSRDAANSSVRVDWSSNASGSGNGMSYHPVYWLKLERNPGDAIVHFIFPMFLITLLAFSNFFVRPTDGQTALASRLNLLFMTLFTIVVFRSMASDSLPTTKTVTHVDHYVGVCVGLVFVMSGSAILAAYDDHSDLIDSIVAGTLGGGWVLFHIMIFLSAAFPPLRGDDTARWFLPLRESWHKIIRVRIFGAQQRSNARTTQAVQFLEKPSQKWTQGKVARNQAEFELKAWTRDDRDAKPTKRRGR